MNKEQKSQTKPIFKQRTPEEKEAYLKMLDEATKIASENLKKGIYPNMKLRRKR